MFFTTEHSRIGALQRELGGTKKLELLTDPTLNDKLVLARVPLASRRAAWPRSSPCCSAPGRL